ncbi:MAG TPA: type II toxin-antitoxin system RelE/ParE family toxin [Candidatus Methylomirabilis sp.]|nr:type II toxin-antitoxin system RelE/ParE family toxin [Candidatus Methylomirabilis sp.]
MAYKIEYKASVARDLRRIDKREVTRIIRGLEAELAAGGKDGEPLRGEFQGLWRLRIGDYRVIYVRTDEGFLVLRIAHRREAYRK